jgi:hypothetical protein
MDKARTLCDADNGASRFVSTSEVIQFSFLSGSECKRGGDFESKCSDSNSNLANACQFGYAYFVLQSAGRNERGNYHQAVERLPSRDCRRSRRRTPPVQRQQTAHYAVLSDAAIRALRHAARTQARRVVYDASHNIPRNEMIRSGELDREVLGATTP